MGSVARQGYLATSLARQGAAVLHFPFPFPVPIIRQWTILILAILTTPLFYSSVHKQLHLHLYKLYWLSFACEGDLWGRLCRIRECWRTYTGNCRVFQWWTTTRRRRPQLRRGSDHQRPRTQAEGVFPQLLRPGRAPWTCTPPVTTSRRRPPSHREHFLPWLWAGRPASTTAR